jgi:hypothetical protein
VGSRPRRHVVRGGDRGARRRRRRVCSRAVPHTGSTLSLGAAWRGGPTPTASDASPAVASSGRREERAMARPRGLQARAQLALTVLAIVIGCCRVRGRRRRRDRCRRRRRLLRARTSRHDGVGFRGPQAERRVGLRAARPGSSR